MSLVSSLRLLFKTMGLCAAIVGCGLMRQPEGGGWFIQMITGVDPPVLVLSVYTWFTPDLHLVEPPVLVLSVYTWFTPGSHLVELPVLVLSEPTGSDNIAITNRNKTEMVYAYVYAFIVVQKICKSLRLELGPYTSKIVGVDVGGS